MKPRYNIGQNVIIKQVTSGLPAARDADIGQYAGQRGTVTNYFWLSPHGGEVFYIYTVKVGDSQTEIVLHEDEMEASKAKV